MALPRTSRCSAGKYRRCLGGSMSGISLHQHAAGSVSAASWRGSITAAASLADAAHSALCWAVGVRTCSVAHWLCRACGCAFQHGTQCPCRRSISMIPTIARPQSRTRARVVSPRPTLHYSTSCHEAPPPTVTEHLTLRRSSPPRRAWPNPMPQRHRTGRRSAFAGGSCTCSVAGALFC